MSATTKKKFVTKEVLEDFPLPDKNRQVVRVRAARGNNLHEVETASGEVYLASMPTKFRKHVWIKRGDYILVEPIEEGGKVKAEITHILFKEQIKHIQDSKLWPEEFAEKPAEPKSGPIAANLLPPSDDEDDDDDDNKSNKEDMTNLVINLNRVTVNPAEYDDSDTDEDEDDNDDREEESDEGQEKNKDTEKEETSSKDETVDKRQKR